MYDPALHLFIDDHYIRSLFALKRVFGVPVQHREPLFDDVPGRTACWASVLREGDGRFRMWYQSLIAASVHELATAGVWGRGEEFGFFPERMAGAVPETQTSVVSYTESTDGRQWERPNLGLYEWQGSRENNIVLDGSGAAAQYDRALTNMDTISVLRDDADPDPPRRYKLICHWETIHVWDNIVSQLGRSDEYLARCWAARAKYLAASPDGIHWEGPLTRIKECAGGGDYAGVTRDERNGRYWFNDRADPGLPEIGYRTAGLCASADLYHWPEQVEMVFLLGEVEDYGMRYQHHGMVPFNYGDQDLGFLELSLGGAPVIGELVSHRDGQRWQRPTPGTPFLQIGPKGVPDDTIVAATRNAPFRVGDELYLFYNGRRYDQATDTREAAMFLATLRLDGFAGLAVDDLAARRHGRPAMLLTQPMTIREAELQLNITGHGGTARIALLRPDLRPYPGYELENSLPIAEDAVRAPVRWRGHPDLSPLAGQPAYILIEMQAGTIYAVRC